MLAALDDAVKQGFLKEPIAHRFMTYPKLATVDKVPLVLGGGAGLVIASGDEYVDLMAAKVLDYMTGTIAQTMTIRGGGNYATRFSAIPPAGACISDPGCVHNDKVLSLFDANGVYDIGYTTTKMGAINQAWLDVLQRLLAGKLAPKDAAAALEKGINSALSE